MADIPLDTLCELMRHMEWADAHVWRAIRAHPAAVQDERVCALLHHYHGVQRAFLTLWTTQPFAPPAADTPELSDTQSAVRDYYRELHAAMATLDDAALRRRSSCPASSPTRSRWAVRSIARRWPKPSSRSRVIQRIIGDR